jgi:ABC-2 type transport system ATP-binding protein
MQPAPVVEFEEVVKRYPGRWPLRRGIEALSGVSFSVGRGEVVGLVGPNRAGKTTLVKVLLSLCRPTAGRVVRFERPGTDRRTLARIGYIHENPAFPRYLGALELLEYYAALALVGRAEARRRMGPLLEQVGLADRAHEPISQYSKGMVQRLALAQALINAPDLLVLDEPSEGLDLVGRNLVCDVVREQRRRGRSVLLVTHLARDIEQLADRVAIIKTGRLAYFGPLADLLRGGSDSAALTLELALSKFYDGDEP